MPTYQQFMAEAADANGHKIHTTETMRKAIANFHGSKHMPKPGDGDYITKVKYLGAIQRPSADPHHKYEVHHHDGGKDIVHASHDGKTADYVA